MKKRQAASMTGPQMIEAMGLLNITVERFAQITGATERTVINWRGEASAIPEIVARLLRYALIDAEILVFVEFAGSIETSWSLAEFHKKIGQFPIPFSD
jgi:hypothetical protein